MVPRPEEPQSPEVLLPAAPRTPVPSTGHLREGPKSPELCPILPVTCQGARSPSRREGARAARTAAPQGSALIWALKLDPHSGDRRLQALPTPHWEASASSSHRAPGSSSEEGRSRREKQEGEAGDKEEKTRRSCSQEGWRRAASTTCPPTYDPEAEASTAAFLPAPAQSRSPERRPGRHQTCPRSAAPPSPPPPPP